MANCLITSAGSNNGVNIIKALGRHRKIAVDSKKLSAGLYLADSYYIVPKARARDYIGRIKKICYKERIDIIFPSYSKEIGVLNKVSELSNKLVVSKPEVYKITENKILCKAFLESIRMDVPKQYPDNFPMIVKPISGTGSKNTVRVNNKNELCFYFKENMFYEEFIQGKEYTVIGVSDRNGKMICALPTVRIEKRGGMAIKSRAERNDKLVILARKIAEELKLVGVWNIQCIEKNKRYYFIDINNRFPSGSMPLATACGMNIPEILISILNGRTPRVVLEYNKTSIRYYDTIIIR